MTAQAQATMFKMQILKNSNLYEECGALMTCESGEWTPAQFATEAEGLAAVAKAFSLSDNAMGDFARAVEVGSADDLAAVILDMVKRSKCLNKNANGYVRHDNIKEAARLRAIRDDYMARARAAKVAMASAKRLETLRTEREDLAEAITHTSECMRELEESGAHDGFVDLIDARRAYGCARDAYLRWESANAEEWVALEAAKAADPAEAIEAARTERAERLAHVPKPDDYAFITLADLPSDHGSRLSLALRMRSLLEMRADFKARGKLVLLGQTNALIDTLCDSAEA